MKRNKSKMTKIAIVLVIAVFIFSLFKIGTTKASTEVVELTNVEIASKSDTVDVDSVKIENGKIKNNVIFHKVGDELTYNVTISNKDEKNYVLKTISDNNENESITYSYSGYEGAKLEANKAATFKVTITYAKEVTDITQREQSNSVVLTLTFEDEAGNEKEEDVAIEPEDKTPPVENNNKNPQTGDNIAVYITTAVASLILLIILTRKQMVMKKSSKRNNHGKHGKHGMKMLGLILAIALVVPTFTNISKAATSSLNTTLETSIKFMDKLVVSYEVNGEAKDKVIPYDGTIENLESPTKEGYNFTGWKLEDGTEVTEETKITADTVLVPQFEEKVKSSTITITVKNEQQREEEKQVTISAVNTNVSDNEVKLQYSLDDGETWTDYAGAITITENGMVKARTVVIETGAVIGEQEKEIDTIMTTATFRTGKEINQKMMELAGVEGLVWEVRDFYITYSGEQSVQLGGYWEAGDGYFPYVNESITAIKKANNEQYETVKDTLTETNIVSTSNSKKTIYMWFDNGIIYYYSEAETIFLNEDASYMFAYFLNLSELDLNNINTSKTVDMQFLIIFNQGLQEINLSSFNTSNVTKMNGMFLYCMGCQRFYISNFDTSKVTDMSCMFAFDMQITELDVSNFDTSKVTDMNSMFFDCENLTELDVSNFDTSKVIYMYFMFYNCKSLTELDVSNFDTSNVTNMSTMFSDCENLTELDVSNFDTSKVTDMRCMFFDCENLTELDVSNFDTSKVIYMHSMFYYCRSLTELDVSNFDTSKVTYMSSMFSLCENLKTIYVSEKFDVSNVVNSEYMFYYSTALVGGNGTAYDSTKTDKTYAVIDTSTTPGYFTDIADKP